MRGCWILEHLWTDNTVFTQDFLDAFSHLYKRVCPSVRLSVRWSVPRSVTHKLKPYKNAVFDQNYYQCERGHILCRVYGLVKWVEQFSLGIR